MRVEVDPREIDTGYEDLANAIVAQAVDDYRRLLRGKRIIDNLTRKTNIKECEEFFLSDWFHLLTNVDGQTIINKLRREYENECKVNTANSRPY